MTALTPIANAAVPTAVARPKNALAAVATTLSILFVNEVVFVADTEPLLIEGALSALHGGEIVWQLRSDKSLVEDSVLKDNGLWHTGKYVGWKDARDTNDAIIHALAYLKKNKHVPTLKKYWGNND